MTENRSQELVEAGERKVAFCLPARRSCHEDDALLRGLRARDLQQRRLADSGLAAQQQRQPASMNPLHRGPQRIKLGLATK